MLSNVTFTVRMWSFRFFRVFDPFHRLALITCVFLGVDRPDGDFLGLFL